MPGIVESFCNWCRCCQGLCVPGLEQELAEDIDEIDVVKEVPDSLREPIQSLKAICEAGDQPDPLLILEIAEGFYTEGIPQLCLVLARVMPQLVTSITPESTAWLSRAMQAQANSLQALDRLAEAQATAAIAQHLHTLSTRVSS